MRAKDGRVAEGTGRKREGEGRDGREVKGREGRWRQLRTFGGIGSWVLGLGYLIVDVT